MADRTFGFYVHTMANVVCAAGRFTSVFVKLELGRHTWSLERWAQDRASAGRRYYLRNKMGVGWRAAHRCTVSQVRRLEETL